MVGFEERKQAGYTAENDLGASQERKMFTEADIVFKDGRRWIQRRQELVPLHPAFGCMKGTLVIPEGLDLTMPVEPEWAEAYDDE